MLVKELKPKVEEIQKKVQETQSFDEICRLDGRICFNEKRGVAIAYVENSRCVKGSMFTVPKRFWAKREESGSWECRAESASLIATTNESAARFLVKALAAFDQVYRTTP